MDVVQPAERRTEPVNRRGDVGWIDIVSSV